MGLNIADLAISSPAFENLGRLEDRFCHHQDDVQPALHISGVPDGTQELAIVCHDPDAPLPWGFTHWTLYGVPADTTEIAEGAGDASFRPGPNDFGGTGYGGPAPPPGHGPHHYYFWVYALGTSVDGTPDRDELLRRYGSDVIEQNRVIGVYER